MSTPSQASEKPRTSLALVASDDAEHFKTTFERYFLRVATRRNRLVLLSVSAADLSVSRVESRDDPLRESDLSEHRVWDVFDEDPAQLKNQESK